MLSTTLYLSGMAAAAQVAAPAFDFSSLGHIDLVGSFSGASLYQDTRQRSELTTNSSGGLYQQVATGVYIPLGSTDGSITTSCTITNTTAPGQRIYLGGSFTRVAGLNATNIVAYDPATSTFSALGSGLPGQINALYCDSVQNRVYIGGQFDAVNSSNAVVWSPVTGAYTPLPFGGFNGQVNTIVADDASIFFGGQFDAGALGSSGSSNPAQLINLQSSYVTSVNPTQQGSYANPNNIICPPGIDGPSSTWLAADNEFAAWQSRLNFTVRPTKLRLRNTAIDGRGTATFRYVFSPNNGIANMSFTDASGQRQFCDSQCALRQGTAWQEFTFVNVVEQYGFQIAISAWYGSGAGLSGIELYQDDLYAYAVEAYNAPTCSNVTFASTSSDSGPWTQRVIGTEPGFLAASLTGPQLAQASVTFQPQISQRGNYSVRVSTPGCLLDSSCATRGQVRISVYATPNSDPVNVTLYQTNQYDKYDTVYQGLVAQSTSSFRPTVVLAPLTDQAGTVSVVASRVQFLELGAIGTDGLNGLYLYNAANTTSSSTILSTSYSVDATYLGLDAEINTILVSKPSSDSTLTIIAGNFTGAVTDNGSSSSGNVTNVAILPGNAARTVQAPGGQGLNAAVASGALLNDVAYFGGNFTSFTGSLSGSASYVAAYNITSQTWRALGGGVNGPVTSVFVTNGTLIGVSGSFTEINAFSSQPAQSAAGVAFWNTATSSWSTSAGSLTGDVSGATTLNGTTYLFGNLRSAFQQAADDVVSVIGAANQQRLARIPLSFDDATTSSSAVSTTGVVLAGAFYNASSTRSISVFGGSFTANTTSGATARNVVFYNSTGLSYGLPDGTISNASTVYATHVDGSLVWIGGNLTGSTSNGQGGSSTLAGLFSYDLVNSRPSTTQPGALTGAFGTAARVNVILSRPNVQQLVVAGSFENAGSLACPALCVLDKTSTTWQRPSSGFDGTVNDARWISTTVLLMAGDFRLNGTRQYLATFDFASQSFASVASNSSGSVIPGPARIAVSDTNATSQVFVAGMQDGASSSYLVKYNGSTATDLLSTQLGTGSQIYGLQFVPLARSRTASASANSSLASDRSLLVLGNLNVVNTTDSTTTNCAVAVYDGTTLTPYILAGDSSMTSGGLSTNGGTVRALLSDQSTSFALGRSSRRLSRGVIIVIALCIALFLVFLIVALGALAGYLRRRREGYRPVAGFVADHPAATLAPGDEKRRFGTGLEGVGGAAGVGTAGSPTLGTNYGATHSAQGMTQSESLRQLPPQQLFSGGKALVPQ